MNPVNITEIKEQPSPILFLLVEREKGRDGEDAGVNILSIYKSREDCETVIKAHKKNGQSKWGFEIPEHHEFEVVEVSREVCFDLELPSWANEMKNIQNALEEIMADLDKQESDVEKEATEE